VERLSFSLLSLPVLHLILFFVSLPDYVLFKGSKADLAFSTAASLSGVWRSSKATTALAGLHDTWADTGVRRGCHHARKTLHCGGAKWEGLATTTRKNCTCL